MGTFNDVKRMKNQVENDVKLLRNRVRMLQMEHEKAQKKIKETAKKTEELVNLRKRNDERFMRVSAAGPYSQLKISRHVTFYACSIKWTRLNARSKSDKVVTKPSRVRGSVVKTFKMPATTCMFQSCKAPNPSKTSSRRTR